jgi:hypothetical protein
MNYPLTKISNHALTNASYHFRKGDVSLQKLLFLLCRSFDTVIESRKCSPAPLAPLQHPT